MNFCCWRLALYGFFCFGVTASAPAAFGQERPSLVVVVSVDQFAYEYLERFSEGFSDDGLVKHCREQGVWFSDCKHQHAVTKTGPGHAVQLTGTYPFRHGIIGNSWFDRDLGQLTYCVRDPEAILVGAKTSDNPVSPKLLIADTVGDQLKLASRGKSKVFTVAVKDRAAILMGGRMADAAIWMSNQGDWITSNHYARMIPDSMAELNASKANFKFAGQSWNRLLKPSSYTHGEKEVSDEERPAYDMTKEFPHVLPKADHKYYIKHLACSPFGNLATFAAAKALVVGENLGQDEHPDILGINLSSNDYVGHSYGPDSLEVEDMTYRTDVMLGDFVRFIRCKLGSRKFVVFVTADHGVAPIPELAAKRKLRAVRNALGESDSKTGNIPEMETQLEAHLERQLKQRVPEQPCDDKIGIVQAFVEDAVYLNAAHPLLMGGNLHVARRLTRDWVLQHPSIAAALTHDELLRDAFDSQLNNLMRRSYHPRRSGDVMFVMKPYHINGTAATTHGSPWHYDRHVPLLVVGDVVQGHSKNTVSPASIATTIARLLKVEFPSMAEAPPLSEVKLK